MKAFETESMMKQRQVTSLKNFRYNRFLIVRYMLAAFFFMNLYWGIAMLLAQKIMGFLPLALMILCVLGFIEQAKLYGYQDNQVSLNHTKRLFQVQLVANIGLLIGSFIGFMKILFPFLKANENSRAILGVILVAGILISSLMLRRIWKIERNLDRGYQSVQEFQKIIK